jgi:hypothetical protein
MNAWPSGYAVFAQTRPDSDRADYYLYGKDLSPLGFYNSTSYIRRSKEVQVDCGVPGTRDLALFFWEPTQ